MGLASVASLGRASAGAAEARKAISPAAVKKPVARPQSRAVPRSKA